MLEYYEKRHPEYEAVYAKLERQDDLVWLEARLNSYVENRRVLELACGTGYWTRRMAEVTSSIHATDASEQLSSAALNSCRLKHHVTTGTLDAFNPIPFPNIDCVVAGFFFSHVLIRSRKKFLKGIAYSVEAGTRIVLFDNKYVEGSSTSISRTTEDGDTYQLRKLYDGSRHEVLKNFPTQDELIVELDQICDQVSVEESDYFWFATGITK